MFLSTHHNKPNLIINGGLLKRSNTAYNRWHPKNNMPRSSFRKLLSLLTKSSSSWNFFWDEILLTSPCFTFSFSAHKAHKRSSRCDRWGGERISSFFDATSWNGLHSSSCLMHLLEARE